MLRRYLRTWIENHEEYQAVWRLSILTCFGFFGMMASEQYLHIFATHNHQSSIKNNQNPKYMQRWSISRQYHGNLWPNFRHLRPPIIPALGPFRGRWASSRVRLRGMAFVPQILSFHVTHRMPASAHRWFKADKLQSFFRGQQRLVPVMQTFLSPWAWWKTLIEAQMQKICLSGIYPKPHCEGFSACFNVFSTFNVDPRWSTWIHFGV